MNSSVQDRPTEGRFPGQRETLTVWATPTLPGKLEQENARLRLALREMRHRCGNQWQQMLGLIEMEREGGQSTHTDTAGCMMRLRALLTAFVALNQTLDTDIGVRAGIRSVPIRHVLTSVLALLQTTAREDSLYFTLEESWLSEKGCTALLLICAELVCNAGKHGRDTTLVTFRAHAGRGTLEVRDDGPGFPSEFQPEFQIETQQGQGLQLVAALCRFDLNGTMRCHNDVHGGVVTLTFPVLFAPDTAIAEESDDPFCGKPGVVCFGDSI